MTFKSTLTALALLAASGFSASVYAQSAGTSLSDVQAQIQANPDQATQILVTALGGVEYTPELAVQYAQAAISGLEQSGLPQERIVELGIAINQVLSPDGDVSLIVGQAIADATVSIESDTAQTYAFNQVGETFETADVITATGSGAPVGFRSLSNVFANFGGGSVAASGTSDDDIDPANPAASGN